MIYLHQFIFPSQDREFDFFNHIKRKCYTNFYPFQVLARFDPTCLTFEPITILYGGNGSGKSTALNIMAEKLGLNREAPFNRSSFYTDYLDLCDFDLRQGLSDHCRVITSDDVFDYALNVRALNEGIDTKREAIFEDYLDKKYAKFQMKSLDDYEALKAVNEARSKTQSRYTKDNLMDNIRTHSNGENAYRYFTQKIADHGLYLLDEPENSLSPARQLELKAFIEESVRYFGCQFIIATHSPFLLSLAGAKIYNLESEVCETVKWTDLENVRAYHDFFKKNGHLF